MAVHSAPPTRPASANPVPRAASVPAPAGVAPVANPAADSWSAWLGRSVAAAIEHHASVKLGRLPRATLTRPVHGRSATPAAPPVAPVGPQGHGHI